MASVLGGAENSAKLLRPAEYVQHALQPLIARGGEITMPLSDDKGVVVPFLSKPLLSLRCAIRGAVRQFRLTETQRMAERHSARLAAIAAASSDAIISVGTDLSVHTWNAGAQRLFGYSEAEARGRAITDLIVPDAYEAERSAIYTAAMRYMSTVLRETVRRHKDGHFVPVEINVSPVVDGSGKVTELSVILRDIGERRRAEDALRRQAERQSLLLDITSDLIRASEPGELGRMTFEHVKSIFGAVVCTNYRLDPAGQQLKLVFVHGIPPEHLEGARSLQLGQEYCGTAAASCQPLVADKLRIASDPNGGLVRKLGATAYACYPLMASDGRLLGTFAVASATRESFTDDEVTWLGTITNFLAQAWERFEAEQGLRASEERLRLSQDAAGLGHWDSDFASGTLVWSDQTRKLLGVNPAEPASTALLLSRVRAEDRPRLEKYIASSARPDSDHVRHLEFRIVMPDGAVRWLEDQSRVETNAAGTPIRAVGVVRDVTARKNAEEAQARLAAIVTSSADAIVGKTLDGIVTSWNRAAERMFGYSASEMIGQSIRRLVPTDRQGEEDAILACLARSKSIDRHEMTLLAKDGRTLEASITVSPMRDAEGNVIGCSKIVRDITLRKRTEARLAEREAQLALFVEDAPAAIAMFDTKMNYLAVSRRLLSDYQLPATTEIIGRSHYEIFPNIPARWREIHARVLAGEELAHEEDPYLRQDGRTDWIRWSMKPWRTVKGRIGGAMLFAEVITEQVEARRALADSESRFRAMFESAAVGIALVTPDGRWLRVNDALCGFLGYPVDELLTKTFRQVTYPDDLAADVAQAELMREGKIETYEFEKRYVRKDGALVWGRKTASCVRKSDGSIDYFVFVVQDISMRKAHQEHVQLLMREVNHRSKNMLSLVQAIARRTTARDHEDFVERFSERIQALAANQDILVRNEWRGVDVKDLVRGQLAHLADLVGSRISMDGPNLRLNATAAQAIGLALHELSTNAGKYGALSVDAGRVDVSWRLDDDIFTINWTECDGPPVSRPERSGFGTTVVDLMAKRTVDGEVHFDFIPSGVVWNLTCPAANALERNALHKNSEPSTPPAPAPPRNSVLLQSAGRTEH